MSLEQIMKEKISADHLLFVSLKYTKTCDVMQNLLKRWKIMIDLVIDDLLIKLKKKKKIPSIPKAPRMKIEVLKKALKKFPEITETLEIHEFFKKVPDLEKTREAEFRKNVCLKIIEGEKETRIDMDKLKEYSEILETFIKFIKEYLSK